MRFRTLVPSLIAITALILCSISYSLAREKHLLKIDLNGLLDRLTSAVHQAIPKKQFPSIPEPTRAALPLASIQSSIQSEVSIVTSAVRSEATTVTGDLTSFLDNAIQNIEKHLQLEIFYDRYITPDGTESGSYEPFASLDLSAVGIIPGAGSIESTLETIKEAGNLINPRNIQRVGYDLPLFALVVAILLTLTTVTLHWVEKVSLRWIILGIGMIFCVSSSASLFVVASILLAISYDNPLADEGVSISTNSELCGIAIAAAIIILLLAFVLLLGEISLKKNRRQMQDNVLASQDNDEKAEREAVHDVNIES